METFKVNRNSWHYKVASQWFREEPKNFCEYWRSFFLSVMGIIVVGLLGFGLAFMLLGGPLVSTYYLLFDYAAFNPDSWYAAGAFCTFLLTLVIGIGLTVSYYKNRRTAHKEPGIFRMKYTAWKEKYCPSVEYNDEGGE